jgi:hypothetical protein
MGASASGLFPLLASSPHQQMQGALLTNPGASKDRGGGEEGVHISKSTLNTLCLLRQSRYSQWLPVLIADSRKIAPERPQRPPCHSYRGLVHTNHTRCAESRNGYIQRISGPPSDPKVCHVAPAAAPAANLGPGTRPEPAPTTGGTDGIQAAGSPTTHRGCRRDHACAGGMVQRELGERGGGAGRPVGPGPASIPALHSCPHGRHRVGRNQDRTTQPTFKAILPVGDFQFAC